MKTGHPIVDRIAQLQFEGNILDYRWLGHPRLCNEQGKFNPVAALVLADIISWYRPSITRDPFNSTVIGVTKKFDRECLYKEYQSWGDGLGFSKRQMQDAIAFLKRAGLIRAWAAPALLRSGVKSNNLLHVEPIPDAICDMTFGGSPSHQGAASSDSGPRHLKQRPRGVPKKREAPPAKEKSLVFECGATPKKGRGLSKKREACTVRHSVITQQTTTPGTTQANNALPVVAVVKDRNKSEEEPEEPASQHATAESTVSSIDSGTSHPSAHKPGDLQTQQLVRELRKAKIGQKEALRMATEQTGECQWQLAALSFQDKLRNPAGFLKSAIEQQWDLPGQWDEYLAQQKRSIERCSLERNTSITSINRAKAQMEEARKQESENASLDASFQKLTPEEQSEINQQVRLRCFFVEDENHPAFQAERRLLLREYLTLKGPPQDDDQKSDPHVQPTLAVLDQGSPPTDDQGSPPTDDQGSLQQSKPKQTPETLKALFHSEASLDALFRKIDKPFADQIETLARTKLHNLGIQADETSQTWLSVRRSALRELIQTGVIPIAETIQTEISA